MAVKTLKPRPVTVMALPRAALVGATEVQEYCAVRMFAPLNPPNG